MANDAFSTIKKEAIFLAGLKWAIFSLNDVLIESLIKFRQRLVKFNVTNSLCYCFSGSRNITAANVKTTYGMSSKKNSNRKLKPDFSVTQITTSFNERSLLTGCFVIGPLFFCGNLISYLFYIYLFYLYIYSPDLQESDGGANT